MTDLSTPSAPSSGKATDEVHSLLDKAKEAFHRARGDSSRDRAEQFDAHLATIKMVVDHTQANLDNEAAEAGGNA